MAPTAPPNPFNPEPGGRPPTLLGRNRELASLQRVVAAASGGRLVDPVMLVGGSGSGRSTFVNLAISAVQQQGVIGLVVRRGRRVSEAVDSLITASGRTPRAFDERDVQSRIDLLGRALNGRGCVVLADDLVSSPHDARADDVIQLSKAARAKGIGVSVLAASAPLPLDQFPNTRLDIHELLPLTEADTRVSFERPAAAVDVGWDPSALEHAVRASGGHPDFIQLIGRAVIDHAGPDRVISPSAVEAAVKRIEPLAMTRAREFATTLRLGEKTGLKALAALPVSKRVEGSDIAGGNGAGSLDADAATKLIARLARHGYVSSSTDGAKLASTPLGSALRSVAVHRSPSRSAQR